MYLGTVGVGIKEQVRKSLGQSCRGTGTEKTLVFQKGGKREEGGGGRTGKVEMKEEEGRQEEKGGEMEQ